MSAANRVFFFWGGVQYFLGGRNVHQAADFRLIFEVPFCLAKLLSKNTLTDAKLVTPTDG